MGADRLGPNYEIWFRPFADEVSVMKDNHEVVFERETSILDDENTREEFTPRYRRNIGPFDAEHPQRIYEAPRAAEVAIRKEFEDRDTEVVIKNSAPWNRKD